MVTGRVEHGLGLKPIFAVLGPEVAGVTFSGSDSVLVLKYLKPGPKIF